MRFCIQQWDINEVGGATERVLINNGGCAKSVTESLAELSASTTWILCLLFFIKLPLLS